MNRRFTTLSLSALIVLPAMSSAEMLYGLTTFGQIVTFDSSAPSVINSGMFVSGLQSNERLVDIDFRPGTGELFALGSSNRMYTINAGTGAATAVGSAGVFSLNGVSFGIDFNPTVDRLRVVSDTRQNLRLNPFDGSAIVDGTLTYNAGDPGGANPSIAGAAYTNNFAGASTTSLYLIDAIRNSLVVSTNPNGGNMATVGALGVDVTGVMGFDISGTSGTAFAAFQTAGGTGSGLYSINLATGQATLIGGVGSGGSNLELIGLTAAPVPEPASMAILGLGAAALLRRRRK